MPSGDHCAPWVTPQIPILCPSCASSSSSSASEIADTTAHANVVQESQPDPTPQEESETNEIFGKNGFNREKYFDYLQLCERVCIHRIQLEKSFGSSTGVDSVVITMEDLYGPLEKNHPRVSLLTAELTRYSKEITDKALENHRLVHSYTEENYMETLCTQIALIESQLQPFKDSQLRNVVDLNPYTNAFSVENFLLPRRYLTFENFNLDVKPIAIANEHLLTSDCPGELEESEIATRDFTGLGIFDPMLQGEKVLVLNTSRTVGKALPAQLNIMLRKFPYGISYSKFQEIHHEVLGYRIDWQAACYTSLLDMIMDFSDACFVKTNRDLPPPLDRIVYSAALKNITCSIQTSLHRLWHTYTIFVSSLNSPVPLKDTWKNMCDVFGYDRFILCHWGFTSTQGFVKYCQDLYRNSILHIVVPVENLDVTQSDNRLYIFHGDISKLPAAFIPHSAYLSGQRASLIPEPTVATPKVFLTIADIEKEWISDSISPGDVITCKRGFARRPYCFSLISLNDKFILLGLRRKMHKYYVKAEQRGHLQVEKHTKVPKGALLAVKYGKYWLRGVALQRNTKRHTYRVFLLDEAMTVYIKESNIAILSKRFLGTPPMGIMCRLNIGNLGIESVEERKNRLHAICVIPFAGSVWTVKFLHREWFLGHSFWTVQMQTRKMDVSTDGKWTLIKQRNFGGKLPRRFIKLNVGKRHARGSLKMKDSTTPVVASKIRFANGRNRIRKRVTNNDTEEQKPKDVQRFARTYAPFNCTAMPNPTRLPDTNSVRPEASSSSVAPLPGED